MNYFTFFDGIIKYNDIRPLYAGTEQCAPLHSFGPISHHHALVFYCKSGKGVYSTDNGLYQIEKGQLFIVNPEEVTFHQADEFDPWHYTWIAFTGTICERISKLSSVLDLKDTSIFDDIEQLIMSGEMKPEKYLICLIKLFTQLFDVDVNSPPDFAIRAKQMVDLHYMENISVESIANAIGVDRRYLLRCFKRRFGITVIDYVLKVRMENAVAFLSQGNSVKKVSVMCGYPDPYSFSKMFKKYHGSSPISFIVKKNK